MNVVRTKVWLGVKRFHGERGQLHRYIETACQNACTDLYRCVPRRPSAQGDRIAIQFEPFAPQHELALQCQDDGQQQRIVEMRLFLRDALPRLPATERQAVGAFLTYDSWLEAERALDIPRQTLASRFQAAACRLATLMALR